MKVMRRLIVSFIIQGKCSGVLFYCGLLCRQELGQITHPTLGPSPCSALRPT